MESIDEGKEEKSNSEKKQKLDDPNKFTVSGSASNKKPKVPESSSSKGRSSSARKSVSSFPPSMPRPVKKVVNLLAWTNLLK